MNSNSGCGTARSSVGASCGTTNEDGARNSEANEEAGGLQEDGPSKGQEEIKRIRENGDLQWRTSSATVQVPTKQHDGGTERESAQGEGPDSFDRWSNDNARMLHLLSLEEGGPDRANDNNEDWMGRTGFQGFPRQREGSDETERKTRITTELHPKALLLDALRRGD
ncbi:hypothetical protein ACHAWF_006852 [Thalassiosira exigua]